MKSGQFVLGVPFLLFLLAFAPVLSAETLDKQDVNPFDRALMFPYSEGFSIASEVTQYSAILMPLSFAAIAPSSDWGSLALMYAGSTALAFGGRTVLKDTISRDRPYMYYDGTRPTAAETGDDHKSFPSGHSTMAFNGAAFTATVFALRYPDSKYRVPVTAAAFTLAGATAILRVASGNHFASDVMAGALLGSFSGFIVPYVSYKFGWFDFGGKNRLSVTPLAVSFSMDL